MGAFEKPVDQVTTLGGYAKGKGPKCPACKSRNTFAVWRDAVWEETGCKCKDCGHEFVK